MGSTITAGGIDLPTMSSPISSPSPWPVPDLSLPPKPPTPNHQASVSVPSTPPNTYGPSGSTRHQATTPNKPVFSPIPPWRLEKTQRVNRNTQPWTPVPYATQSPSYTYQSPSYTYQSARYTYQPPIHQYQSPTYAYPSPTYTYQPTSSPSVSASQSPAPRQPGTSEDQLSPKNHLRRNERRKQARRNQQPQRLEASPLSPRREAVGKHSRGKRSPSIASLEKYISEKSTSASGTNDIQATKMASDPLRDYIDLCRRAGKEEFGPDEQAMLCSYIGATKEDQRDMVYYLVNSIPCRSRSRSLTYKLAFWLYIQDKNYAAVAKLLGERLGDFDPVDDYMMGLREVGELMDCQIALDACRAGRNLSAALAQLLQY